MWTNKQKDYINQSQKRWNVKVGATGTGKTYVDYKYTIPARTKQFRDKEGINLLIGVTTSTLERNVLQPMREMYGDTLVGNIVKGSMTVSLFGETFYVIGAEKENATNKIQGATVKYVYGDEFVDWNENFFKMLTTRLRVQGATADLTGNPKQPSHWAKEFIDKMIEEDMIFYQTSTIYDNPTLPKEFVQSQEIELKGTTEYKRLLLGQWAVSEGGIYPMLRREDHVITNWNDKIDGKYVNEWRQRANQVIIGVDIGGNKSKTTFNATAIIPNKNDSRLIEAIVTVKDNRFTEERDSTYVEQELLKFIEDLEDEGYHIRSIRVDNAEQLILRGIHKAVRQSGRDTSVKGAIKMAINERIRLYQRLLNLNRYKIVDTCKHTYEAFETALWSDKTDANGKDRRLDDGTTNIDTLDAQEYSTEELHNLLIKG